MLLKIPKDEYQHAVDNPYYGCVDPRAAAFGRCAEPVILSAAAELYNLIIVEVDDVRAVNAVPPELAAELLRPKRHDGLAIEQGRLMAVIECKLSIAGRQQVFLSKTETELLKTCAKHNIPYLLFIAEQRQRNSFNCYFLGCADLASPAAPELTTDRFNRTAISTKDFAALCW